MTKQSSRLTLALLLLANRQNGVSSAFQGRNRHINPLHWTSSIRTTKTRFRDVLTLPLLPKEAHDEAIVAVAAADKHYIVDQPNSKWLSSVLRDVELQGTRCWSDAEAIVIEAKARMQEAVPFLDKSVDSFAQLLPSLSMLQTAKAEWDYLASPRGMETLDPSTYRLTQAGFVGAITGLLVVGFKVSIEAVRRLFYEQDFLATHHSVLPLIPALGGAVVGLLLLSGGPFAPGLKATVKEVEQHHSTEQAGCNALDHLRVQWNASRKSVAAIATLGTGCSLGPEGPSVEIGLNVARTCIHLSQQIHQGSEKSVDLPLQGWNRILLSSGAAAGVAAGFNAPIAGVFFALEIMQKAFGSIDIKSQIDNLAPQVNVASSRSNLLPMTSPSNITPILLASAVSALISQSLLGDHLVLTLTQIDLKTPLLELPLYLVLGGLSGVMATVFSQSSKLSQKFFNGNLGLPQLRNFMSSIPEAAKPVIGGLLCGLVGLYYPQILFFGYETLNALLKNNAMPVSLALTLLVSKFVMTAVSVGSGLVGGTFALALFLGAMLGTAFQNESVHVVDVILNWTYNTPTTWHLDAMTMGSFSQIMHQLQQHAIPASLQIGSVPAYAMVGAASTMAAMFRAPLTASLLLFEVTRNYDSILPLLASAGLASVIGELLEERLVYNDMADAEAPRPCLMAQDGETEVWYLVEETASQDPLSNEGAIVPFH
jgi:H+/Cl- antiporter ClcA